MDNERSFAVVFGYLPGIDRQDDRAIEHGLDKRFALALNSYREAAGEMVYDYALLYQLLGAVMADIPHDHIRIHYDAKDQLRNIHTGELLPRRSHLGCGE